MNQKKMLKLFSCMAVLIFLCLSGSPTYATEEESAPEIISVGMNLPQITLDAPASKKDKEYLSLKTGEPFSLSQIPAKLIVLEIFSVYCPHCRMQAPKLNKVYKLIQLDMELSPDIKMIGIAALDDQNKTDKWKTTLHVPFPLFADLNADIWGKFGKPGVPYTLLISNSGKVLSTNSGVTEDTDDFFRHLKNVFRAVEK
ncbi:MAG: TlpA family protein disulfide reductase [Deltaproteobacteria bacterium]|nr:TlpA family protein disulfide reductase [Deltaproteobacteria bacterium]